MPIPLTRDKYRASRCPQSPPCLLRCRIGLANWLRSPPRRSCGCSGPRACRFCEIAIEVKRILLKDFPNAARGIVLAWRESVETFPKPLGRPEAVFHSAARDGGLAPLNTVSMSAKRPAAASAIPCLKDSGIQESSFSTTNLATCARSAAGSALNCSMISVALISIKSVHPQTRLKQPRVSALSLFARCSSLRTVQRLNGLNIQPF